ncbi:MAG: histidine phosphatase family protein [Propionibacteriaceae bacterium]|nr:histidine phosphatase family protein [Propionibacteriaceae bacterium]
MATTTVHLVRHGQVENPQHVLYGRLPNWHLSELGRAMAARVGEYFDGAPLTHLRCSPLERAQETMAPIAERHSELPITFDDRVIEAGNIFEGQVFGPSNDALRHPSAWRHLLNPFRPSWGEPYREIADRMRAAVHDAAEAAGEGGQAVIVSHQLPIWIARLDAEGRPFFHDPRARQCSLASVTSLTVAEGTVIRVAYTEPAADLLPQSSSRRFRVGL